MRARLEIHSRAAAIASDLFQVSDQCAAGTGRTFRFVGHKVIDIEAAPDVGIFELAKDRDPDDSIATSTLPPTAEQRPVMTMAHAANEWVRIGAKLGLLIDILLT